MARTLRCGGGYAGEKLKPVCRAYILGIDRSLLSYNRSLLPYIIGLFCVAAVCRAYILGIDRSLLPYKRIYCGYSAGHIHHVCACALFPQCIVEKKLSSRKKMSSSSSITTRCWSSADTNMHAMIEYMYIHIHTYLICMFICRYICTYIYICVCVYIYI